MSGGVREVRKESGLGGNVGTGQAGRALRKRTNKRTSDLSSEK